MLITAYTNMVITQDILKRILHEHITTRLVVMGVEEVTRGQKTLHVHVVAMTIAPRRWLKSNILKQMGIRSCHIKPIYTTQDAVCAMSYICKQATPVVWAPTEQLATQWKQWTFNQVYLMNANWRKANFRRWAIARIDAQMERLQAAGWNSSRK